MSSDIDPRRGWSLVVIEATTLTQPSDEHVPSRYTVRVKQSNDGNMPAGQSLSDHRLRC